eukprot:351270-Chlamydomonas_euryale.AAC.12
MHAERIPATCSSVLLGQLCSLGAAHALCGHVLCLPPASPHMHTASHPPALTCVHDAHARTAFKPRLVEVHSELNATS